MTVHSIDESSCPTSFPHVVREVVRAHDPLTKDVRRLSGCGEPKIWQARFVSRADDPISGDPDVQTCSTHALSEATGVELPEADSTSVITLGEGVPGGLMPGVGQGTRHQWSVPPGCC